MLEVILTFAQLKVGDEFEFLDVVSAVSAGHLPILCWTSQGVWRKVSHYGFIKAETIAGYRPITCRLRSRTVPVKRNAIDQSTESYQNLVNQSVCKY